MRACTSSFCNFPSTTYRVPSLVLCQHSVVKYYQEQAPSEVPVGSVLMPNPATTNPAYSVNIPGLQGAINMATNILQPSQLQQSEIAVSANAPRDLGPGWVMMVDGVGKPYYYHEPSGAVQYHDPLGVHDHCRPAVVGDV